MRLILTLTIAFCCLLSFRPVSAEICGKVDIAPAYVHIDVLQNHKTIHRMDLAAFKGDATIVVWKGLCFKPTLLVGGNNGSLVSTGLGIGHCTPIWDWLMITPSVGVLYTNLHTTLDLPGQLPEELGGAHYLIENVKEKFWSISPYIGLDFTFNIRCDWRIYAQVQYSWSKTHTTLEKKGENGFVNKDKSHSEGPSYGLLLEHDLNDSFSINLGGAYNISLTKEKHGLRGAGCKLGIAYWF